MTLFWLLALLILAAIAIQVISFVVTALVVVAKLVLVGGAAYLAFKACKRAFG